MIRFSLSKLILLGIVALAAETTILATFTVFGARLELLFLIACFAALTSRQPKQAVWACWLLGLIKDLGGAGPLGVHALVFLGAGVIILRLRKFLFREHPLTQAAVAFIGGAAIVLVDALVTAVFAGRVPWNIVFFRSLAAAVFAAVAAPVLIRMILAPKWLLR